jgi:hypothetical protein
MTEFSIGSGGSLPKANQLPVGIKARIVDASFIQSQFTQTIRKGSQAGQEVPRHQLRVVYETGDKSRYVQYYGGVYPKDAGGYNLSKEGSAHAFVAALQQGGIPPGKLENYVGVDVTLTQVPVRNPRGGMSSQAMPTAVHGGVVANKGNTQATPATPAESPYDALTDEDKATLAEALAAGPVSPSDLVEAGLATDAAHAERILQSAPKPKKALLGRK